MQLDPGFEDKAREACLNKIEQTLQDEIGPALKQIAARNWQRYAQANDYDVQFIWEDASDPVVERSGDSVTLRVEWPELSALFEFGVSPHTIEGDPLLHFYWEAKDTWIQIESVDWGSETGGIPESRAIRDALNGLRRVLRS